MRGFYKQRRMHFQNKRERQRKTPEDGLQRGADLKRVNPHKRFKLVIMRWTLAVKTGLKDRGTPVKVNPRSGGNTGYEEFDIQG